MKVAEGVHDLTVDGGSIRCLAKAPILHQDGIQVMGGERIAFRNLDIDCGRADDALINSNLFIKQAGQSSEPADRRRLRSTAPRRLGRAHGRTSRRRVRSGVVDSTLCAGQATRS